MKKRIFSLFAAFAVALALFSPHSGAAKSSAPKKPVLSSVTQTGGKVTLKWNKVAEADGYAVYYSKDGGKAKTLKTTVKTGFTSGVLANGDYTFYVKSYKNVNGEKVYSGKSSAKKVTVGAKKAKNFNFLTLRFNNREFFTNPQSNVLIGDNITLKFGEKLSDNTAADAVVMAFQQPLLSDKNYGSRYLICQKGDFWSNIDHINAGFYIESADKNAVEINKIQSYIQMGGLSQWKFLTGEENFIDRYPEGYTFDSSGVINVTWDIKKAMKEYGSGDAVNFEGNGGGVLKFGLMIWDGGLDPKKLKICWTDVEIFVKNKAKFMEYADIVGALTGEKMGKDLKITQVK